MSVRSRIPVILIVLSLIAFPRPVTAGGWATVRLDVPLGVIETGEPLRIGFMVMRHDRDPHPGSDATLLATNTSNGDEVRASAVEEGPEGHYVVETAFESSGTWQWEISPDPFPATSLPPLTVVETRLATSVSPSKTSDSMAVHSAVIRKGSCDALEGDTGLVLSQLAGNSKDGERLAFVKESRTTIDVKLVELLTETRALTIADENGSTVVACGDISGEITNDGLAIGLREEGGSGYAGIAELTTEGDQTTITVYLAQGLLAPPGGVQPQAATGPTVEITMADSTFSPSKVEIEPGTTVVWINKDNFAHEISSDLPNFTDSGVVDNGDSFSQTFTASGTIDYKCAFHPGMAGTIVVT